MAKVWAGETKLVVDMRVVAEVRPAGRAVEVAADAKAGGRPSAGVSVVGGLNKVEVVEFVAPADLMAIAVAEVVGVA